jgi:N-acetylglutamate synthase-like GNAT family acetyltransferase
VLTIRWLDKRDLDSLEKILEACRSPMTAQELWQAHQDRTVVYIADFEGEPVGISGYQMATADILFITMLAVHPKWLDKGIDRVLLDKLLKKIGNGAVKKIVTEIDERDLRTQLLLREYGFKAVYCNREDESYRFELHRGEPAACKST